MKYKQATNIHPRERTMFLQKLVSALTLCKCSHMLLEDTRSTWQSQSSGPESLVGCFTLKIYCNILSERFPPQESSLPTKSNTPGKINMEPENTPLERRNIFQTIIFRLYVNLGGCNLSVANLIFKDTSKSFLIFMFYCLGV